MKKETLLIIYLSLNVCASAQNIYRTACSGHIERLDSMLISTSINAKDDRGRSLLHWAVACRKKGVFDMLIKRGIDIASTDDRSQTPMHVAVRFNNEEYLSYLVELQSDDNWKSLHGASLLQTALLNKNKTLVDSLISCGVDVNIKNKRGSTPLEISERLDIKDISKLLIDRGADKQLVRKIEPKGEYMGQNPPSTTPEMFVPNFISTEEQEFGSVFNAAGNEFFFSVDVNGRNEIRHSRLIKNQWTKPVTILSHETYGYNDPFLSNDEKRLYFISKQALDGKGKLKDVDIWYVERTDTGWSEPINVGNKINTIGNEYYISFTNDGSMYFASNGHARQDTTRNDHDIYYSKMINNEYQSPVRLGETINTEQYEADVFVSPDESYMIFCSTRDDGFGRGDLYVSFRLDDGSWSSAKNMGGQINTSHYEYCPFVTKDGKYLFYTSNQDIYWVSTEIINELRP